MTLNYNAHRSEIEAAYKRATESSDGDKWVIFDYEGNSNTLKVGEQGTGGLSEFAESFSSGRLQFGVIAVRLSSDVLPKIVLVHWQGEGVQTLRLASTTSHAEEFRRFLKTVHIILHARSEIDIEPDAIRKEVSKLPSTNTNANAESSYSIPEKLESSYKPTKPHIELNPNARDEFWNKMNEEEKRRMAEEKKAREEAQRQYEADRQRIASEIHTKAENYQPEKVTSVYKPVRPHVELSGKARDEFWSKMNEEEKKRQEEERKAREEQQKQFEADRQRIADEIHSKAENYQPDRVTSVYKPVKPHVELNTSAREEFWNKMNEEEKRRVAEEKSVNEMKQKQFEEDRKRIADDIHAKLQIQEKASSNGVDKTSSNTVVLISAGLVGSRKEMFKNTSPQSVPLPKPISTGAKKWPPVSTTPSNSAPPPPQPEPVIQDSEPEKPWSVKEEPKHVYVPEPLLPNPTPVYTAYEEPPVDTAPTSTFSPPDPSPPPPAPVTVASSPPAPSPSAYIQPSYGSQYDVVPEYTPEPEPVKTALSNISEPPAYISSQYDIPPEIQEEPKAPQIDQYDFPPAVEATGLTAKALWDYQAADDTEISFDPDDIIEEIEQVDAGWWKGKAHGRVGLFPANYVVLL
ncbi:unnamed protein product [Caenorhabditis bovis]|uniref:ADF-H domain-containing protein n=1 Tax=Caenorhabditis bovis TaxID=2654633 RepID=A0A8S1EGM3_9PELO|nr:unnamed protein product [Caenorhabditis bovis]